MEDPGAVSEGRREDEGLSSTSSSDDEEEKLVSDSEAQDSLANVTSETEVEQAGASEETGWEDLDSVDLLDTSGPKALDFEVIDFDQFGPQPPDLPRTNNHEEVDQSGAPEQQITHVDSPEMDDGLAKTSSSSEEDELGNEPDMDYVKETQGLLEAVQNLNQLAQEQAKQLEDYRQQLELSATQLAKQSKLHEELKRDLEAESSERLMTDAKLMVFDEVLPNIEEKLRNLSDQLQEQVQLRTKVEEDLRQERKHLEEQVQLTSKLTENINQDSKQLEDEVNLRTELEEDLQQQRKQLEEQANLRSKLEEDLQQDRKHLEEQVQLTSKLTENINQDSQQLEDQAKLTMKLEEDLQQQRKQLEEQIESKSELAATLEQKVQRLEEQIESKSELAATLEQKVQRLEEQSKEVAHKLEEEQDGRMKSEADLMVLREMLSHAEEKLKDVHAHVESLVAQLQEQTELRHGLEEKLDREGKQTLLHQDSVLQLEQGRDERRKLETSLEELRGSLANKAEELKAALESLSSREEELKEVYGNLSNKDMQLQELRESFSNKDMQLKEALESLSNKEHELKEVHESLSDKEMQLNEALESLSNKEQELKEAYSLLSDKEEELNEALESLSNKEEELKGQRDQIASLTAQLEELEEKLERKMVRDLSSESLPVSSMPWSEEKQELVKLLDDQKTLLANQVQEAEKLKSSAQKKVGLLNHQVQNLEVLTDIAETMEHVFSAKEQALKQTLWTVIQAVCLGMGFMHFVVGYRDPLRSSLQPT